MIQIKAVDEQNLLDVCALTPNQDGAGWLGDGHFCCNAVSIAAAKYCPEMHPNAIYHNHVLVGFFMYSRTEEQAGTATICRFMIGAQFQQKGLEERALEHILRGLKIQGVQEVRIMLDSANENAKNLWRSFGFRFTGERSETACCYALAF